MTLLLAFAVLQETHDLSLHNEAGARVHVVGTGGQTGTFAVTTPQGRMEIASVESTERDYTLELLAVENGRVTEGRARIVRFRRTTRETQRLGDQTQEGPETTGGESGDGCVYRIRIDADPPATCEEGEPGEDAEEPNEEYLEPDEWRNLPDHPVAVGETWPLSEEALADMRHDCGEMFADGADWTGSESTVECRLDRVEEAEGKHLAHVAYAGTIALTGTVASQEIFTESTAFPARLQVEYRSGEIVVDLDAHRIVHQASDGLIHVRVGPEEAPRLTLEAEGRSEENFTWE